MAVGEVLVEYLAHEGSTTPLQRIFPDEKSALAYADSIGNLYLSSYILDGHENATVNEE
tara:strand:- start:1011 stop:1187 length:177 start_codon:yes stop_codon:yes gene_type:complete